MLLFYKKIILSFFALLLTFSFVSVSAQTTTLNNSTGLDVTPQTPRIGDSVIIKAYSNSVDLNYQKITWYVDDKIRKEGLGEKEIMIKTQSGQTTKVKAVVTKTDGSKIELTTEITPSEIDLIIEPLSYKSPFYEGKPYFIDQGTFYATVVPNIKINNKKIESKDIFYKWTKDGTVLGKSSGLGQDSIRITGSVPIDDIHLGVEAYDNTTKKLLAKDSKTIEPEDPKVLFYEKNPIYGILYNKAISGSYYMGDRDELTISAEPFSFDFTKNTADNSSYSWEINNNSATSSKNKNELLVVQQENKIKGTANISVSILNTKRDFQEISGDFSLEFGK